MILDNLDDVVRSTYANFPGTVDDIVCDPDEAVKFAAAVQETVPAELLRRLMTLRERGNTPGGLPKKPR